MISSDSRHPKEIRKIWNGQFARFEGLTIVCPLLWPEVEQWHHKLTQVAPTSVYCMMPPASYHMTLSGLWLRKGFASAHAYNQHNNAARSRLAELDLQLRTIIPEPFRMRTDTRASHETRRVELVPYDEQVETTLRAGYKAVCDAFPSRPSSTPHWHLSIAYASGKQEPDRQTADAFAAVMRSLPSVLMFDTPRVCEFVDMTAFVPLFKVKPRDSGEL